METLNEVGWGSGGQEDQKINQVRTKQLQWTRENMEGNRRALNSKIRSKIIRAKSKERPSNNQAKKSYGKAQKLSPGSPRATCVPVEGGAMLLRAEGNMVQEFYIQPNCHSTVKTVDKHF